MKQHRHERADDPLRRRLWLYQAERFPIGRTGLLLAAFSASSISVSAHLASRPLPGIGVFAAAWLVAIIIFFQLRVCDEYKDFDDDSRYRPERPVPSGLVSLQLLAWLAIAAAVVAIGLSLTIAPGMLVLLALVWLWLGLMTAEFFVSAWLKARPFVYLVSHMAIMVLIDLYLTGAEWLPNGAPAPGMAVFLALSLVNGCVLEIGRKTWAPISERPGVETYSALLGAKRSALLWLALCALAWLLLSTVGLLVGAGVVVSVAGAALLLVIALTVKKFIHTPTVAGQKRIDMLAGIWVLICYTLCGFAPYIRELWTP